MIEVLYCLPDSGKLTPAFILCEDVEKALLFVPPMPKIRQATITVAQRQNGQGLVYEDSVSSSFPLKDWGAAATIAIFLMCVLKDDLVSNPYETI